MKKIPKKYVKVFCNKVEFQFNSKPMTLFPLPALPHYFFRPDRAIYNWKYVHRHPMHLDFCRQYCHILLGYNTRIRNFLIPCFLHFLLFFLFTVLFGWMFAVEKYKLLLPRLVKIACMKLIYIFVLNSYGLFTFKSNARWNSETASISVFCCACFLGTLQFYDKSFAIWEDSKVRKYVK